MLQFARVLNRICRTLGIFERGSTQVALDRRSDCLSYALREYESTEETLHTYGSSQPDFRGDTMLDVGCGAGGRSSYYAEHGARMVVGIDIDIQKTHAANEFARLREMSHVHFLVADASYLPFRSGSFDLSVSNEAFEHIPEPQIALAEVQRVVRSGGQVFINFPPLHHPKGSHLYEVVAIPWATVLFPQRVLTKLAAEEYQARGLEQMAKVYSQCSYIPHINSMTVARFEQMIASYRQNVTYYALQGFDKYGSWWRLLTKIPFLREMFTRNVICVISVEK